MTTTTSPAPAAAEPAPGLDAVTSGPALSGLRRLNPEDGLFLRAEHLDQIQQYAEELSRLSTLAAGSGTVYGYELSIRDDGAGGSQLRVTPGLAASEEGRLLRSLTTIDVDLGRLELGVPGRFWVVEVIPAPPVLSGSEPAYTSVCATSCGPGSSISPWRDDAIRVRIRAASIETQWDGGDTARSALASAWFERERAAGGPWLTPRSAQTPVQRLFDRPWEMAAPRSAPTVAAVPLGLLFRQQDEWALDIWAARRDRAAAPPEAAWQPHLSMREWSTYRAQVLQFEDQVADVAMTEDLHGHFVELPPGGFLDVVLDNDEDPVRRHLEQRGLWNDRCRIIHCTADVAISAVALAQRLDRIPLNAEPPAIDFWMPDLRGDLPATQPEGPHGWIAFTRGVNVDESAEEPGELDKPSGGNVDLESPGEFRTSLFDRVRDEESVPVTDVDIYLVSAPRDRTRYAAAIAQATSDERIGVARFSDGWRLGESSSLDEARRGLPDEPGSTWPRPPTTCRRSPWRRPAHGHWRAASDWRTHLARVSTRSSATDRMRSISWCGRDGGGRRRRGTTPEWGLHRARGDPGRPAADLGDHRAAAAARAGHRGRPRDAPLRRHRRGRAGGRAVPEVAHTTRRSGSRPRRPRRSGNRCQLRRQVRRGPACTCSVDRTWWSTGVGSACPRAANGCSRSWRSDRVASNAVTSPGRCGRWAAMTALRATSARRCGGCVGQGST
jgi:hypothetical protein